MPLKTLKVLPVLAFIWISQVFGAPRIRSELPIYDLRQMITRFSTGAISRATIGKIQDGRFRPVESYSVGALGATKCSNLLDRAQSFSLKGMLEAKYIDQETYEALKSSELYLHGDQVTFFSVLTYLSAEEFKNHRSIIDDSQLGQAPPRSQGDMASVAVTVGSTYLVTGYRHTSSGFSASPLPWTKDPVFSRQAKDILAEQNGFNFEIGRAMQVISGTLDHNLKAALISIAHEMAINKGDFNSSRVFVHSYKKANTVLYQRKFPSLRVVAVDPNNSENVILASPLSGLYSPNFPWNYSGPIQSLREINPDVISVPKAWNFLTAVRSSGSVAFDYVDSEGKVGPSPVLLRVSSGIFSRLVSGHTSKIEITRQEEADKIVEVLNYSVLMTEDAFVPKYVDLVSAKMGEIVKKLGDVVSLSNLDPQASEVDSNYELKVLFSGVLQYGEILRQASLEGLNLVRYALTTTDDSLANKIKKLKPSEVLSDRITVDWMVQDNPKGATFNFSDGHVRTFVFTFSDLKLLANENPDLFNSMRDDPALRFGNFHRNGLLSRPTGL